MEKIGKLAPVRFRIRLT